MALGQWGSVDPSWTDLSMGWWLFSGVVHSVRQHNPVIVRLFDFLPFKTSNAVICSTIVKRVCEL